MFKEQTPIENLEKLPRRIGCKDADLSLYEQVHVVKSLLTDELEPYLNAKAALETNLKGNRVDCPLFVFIV